MFSDDLFDLRKDENGIIFIGRDLKFFKFTLAYIRSDGLFSSEYLDQPDKKLFELELEHWGLAKNKLQIQKNIQKKILMNNYDYIPKNINK